MGSYFFVLDFRYYLVLVRCDLFELLFRFCVVLMRFDVLWIYCVILMRCVLLVLGRFDMLWVFCIVLMRCDGFELFWRFCGTDALWIYSVILIRCTTGTDDV